MFGFLKKFFGTSQQRSVSRFSKAVEEINRLEISYQNLSDNEIRAKTDAFKKRYQEGESLDSLLPEAYAVVKNVCRRLVGSDVHVSGYDQKWDMIPYDVQLIGAIAMHHGTISEMQTGEGKTLTATLPLYLNALSGKPVHLITVNDYLVARDCQWVGSILRWLGLTCGALTNDTPPHMRKEIYQNDVVYGTASEFGFDYLRDNSMSATKEEQVQRGYFFAIVDEIDSILIDEARTPLIISGPTPESRQMYKELKDPVSLLVKLQRDLCNRIASEAWREVEQHLGSEDLESVDKRSKEAIRAACKKLWLVLKGTPHSKVLRRARENPDLRNEIEKWDVYFHSDQNKQEKAKILGQIYMTVDEKGSEFELTDRGIAMWAEKAGGDTNDFVMLDLGAAYADIESETSLSEDDKLVRKLAVGEEDAIRKERAHNTRQLLRAHLLMERDIDYIVQEGKVVIIDENTGRPQPGRRFSDGLHQAIEAKEGVEIQRETQTYATVTLQNYFRMYHKLAGMTGTAITEAGEFKEIYKLDVLQIPTYKPCARTDANDEVYMTEREKYAAILKEIEEVHAQGRPILIGTESVEVSEKLARILRQNHIEHTVLNAKYHAQEAEIISQAGQKGAVTVSTNMAGRGTDIKLGADVAKLGGLHVVGTTRHQSRRIDRQLRGRSARLGDPGSSKFFISFEDPLMRLFASPRITMLLKRLRPPEGEPISAKMLNRSIETAQKRVEGRNYTIRKHTLEYDDVMNRQRQEIYNFRNEILHNEDLTQTTHDILFEVCQMAANDHLISRGQEGGWDPIGYKNALFVHFPVSFQQEHFEDDHLSREELEERAFEEVLKAFNQKIEALSARIQEQTPGVNSQQIINRAIASVIVGRIDEIWQEHLLMMDHLRSEVMLRTVAQKDPLMEFKSEAFRLFHDLTARLHTEAARNLFRFDISERHPSHLQEMLSQISLETNRLIFDGMHEQAPEAPPAVSPPEAPPTQSESSRSALSKVGRNDPCPCNSGKKYKRCCGIAGEQPV